MGEDFVVAYAWAEEYVSPRFKENTDEWCARMGVERCNTLEELCEKSDYLLILAPSNPEKHLGYAQTALKYGKRTYIDKTFSPDLKTAQEIFALGKEYNAPFFSSSALRFASEMEGKEGSKSIITTGSGSNFAEYIVHQAEMVVRALGIGAQSVTAKKDHDKTICEVTYDDDRTATMIFVPDGDYAIMTTNADGVTGRFEPASGDYFARLIEEILRFYLSGETCFDVNQTLEVMKIRELAVKAQENL